MNIVCLSGRLIADPEIKLTPSGKKNLKFTIAVKRAYQKDVTDFIGCEAWEQTAQFIKDYAKKGSNIFIKGSYLVDKYQDKDGQTRYTHKINVETAECPRLNGTSGGSTNTLPTENAQKSQISGDTEQSNFTELAPGDDLPF